MPNGHVALADAVRPGGRGWVAAAVVLVVLVGVVSLLPPRGTPGGDIADLGELRATLGHAAAYAVLGFAFAMSVRVPRGESVPPRIFIAIVVILTGYGALLEVLQGAFSARSFQWVDVLANAIGALLGVGAVLATRRR